MSFFTAEHEAIASKYAYEMKVTGNTLQLQPGDATRYVFTFIALNPEEARVRGCSPSAVLVVVDVGERRYAAILDAYSHPSYIQEKMRLDNPHTANVVAMALRFALGKVDIGPFPMER